MTEYGYMSQHTPLDALMLPPGHGEGLWHLDTLWTFKIPAAASGGAFSLAEQLIPKGSAPPVHRHTREDEAWIVLDGEVTFFVEDEQHTAGPGTYVFGPRGRAHTHRVESDTARIATLLIPGTCEAFFRTASSSSLVTGRFCARDESARNAGGTPGCGTADGAARRTRGTQTGSPPVPAGPWCQHRACGAPA
jgi:quercetin dioxygenase-like cupin family protein